MSKDPAARSGLEVLLCYPGLHALIVHRFTHRLWKGGHTLLARFLSQLSRSVTGIEIHPGASIGRRVLIDHGMGVVIGETTVVGDDCVIYQGVTLGAGAAARQGAETRGQKRHPTLGNGVVVGSGAEIQGAITVGNNVQVASGSIVLKDVPDNCIVVGVPGRVLYREGKRVNDVVPDIEAEAIKALNNKVEELEHKVILLTNELSTVDTDGAAAEVAQSRVKSESQPAAKNAVEVFLHGAGI